jgi:predicted transcriptional regulator
MCLIKSPATNYEASTSKGGNKYIYRNKSKDKTTQLESFRQQKNSINSNISNIMQREKKYIHTFITSTIKIFN